MDLTIGKALILVDNIGSVCILADGSQPEVPAGRPEVFVYTI
jgi:hypothetical protein